MTALQGTRPRVPLLSEPFRIFFPLGWLAAVIGVLLWPLFYMELLPFYPGPSHSRLLVLGFIGAFAIGFLGTAGPRMLETPAMSEWHLTLFVTAYVTALIFYLAGQLWLGDATFLVLWAAFSGFIIDRFRRRKDLPPPAFLLAACGVALLLAGLSLLLLSPVLPGWAPLYRLGGDLVYLGFPFCLLLGAAGFILPKFAGYPLRRGYSGSKETTYEWRTGAMEALVTAVVIFGSLVLEWFNRTGTGGWLRAGAVFFFAWRTVPFWRAGLETGIVPATIRSGYMLFIYGIAIAALLPMFRSEVHHIVFIGGIGLTTFFVATQVTLGHAGRKDCMVSRRTALALVATLIFAAMALRVSAGDGVTYRNGLLFSASALWVAAVLLWGIVILPFVRMAEEEEDEDEDVEGEPKPEPGGE